MRLDKVKDRAKKTSEPLCEWCSTAFQFGLMFGILAGVLFFIGVMVFHSYFKG